MKRIVIVGAGVGGLAAAAELARAGIDVTVLEAHTYAGGCAGTFFHKGYRFDAGATLAAGFAPEAPMDLLARRFDIDWQAEMTDVAMQVHLPDGAVITRWADAERWQAERRAWFGDASESFWRWQESTADALWDLTRRLPPWPPQTPADLVKLGRIGAQWAGSRVQAGRGSLLPLHALDAVRPAATHLRHAPDRLRLFVDAQLLISAQTTSPHANALYSAAALDLARLGVANVQGGMGGIAEKLVETVRRLGGQVLYRQEVVRVKTDGRCYVVETKRGDVYPADRVIFNLPPWNIVSLLVDVVPASLRRLPPRPPQDGWGAFMAYVGFDASILAPGAALHHQVVMGEPLGEGNSVFLSLSPAWDKSRAPAGHTALTISTHTRLDSWRRLLENSDEQGYDDLKTVYTDRLLTAAERALPGLRAAADLVMPGTPVAFQRFTHRAWGWVGGFPQTHLLRNWGPRLGKGLWLVGDTIFPGQSVPAVALGGVRVATALLAEMGARVATPTGEKSSLPHVLALPFVSGDPVGLPCR